MKIVEQLHDDKINGFHIIGEILPVAFHTSGKKLIDTIQKTQPDAVISLGLAAGRHKITPERIAINCMDGNPDNTGFTPNSERIFLDGEDGLFTTLPIDKMVDQLTLAGLPAKISNSAGTYVCNHVMYHGLHYYKTKHIQCPTGFIHIPASHELAIKNDKLPSFSHQDLLKAIRLCIKCL